jgi:hypothetical protein
MIIDAGSMLPSGSTIVPIAAPQLPTPTPKELQVNCSQLPTPVVKELQVYQRRCFRNQGEQTDHGIWVLADELAGHVSQAIVELDHNVVDFRWR